MAKFRKDRLLKLVEILRADAKRKDGLRFDMLTWGTALKGYPEMKCGTKACALGAAALSGAFTSAGLTFETAHNSIDFVWRGQCVSPLYAAQRLFGINGDQASYLFLPSQYRRGPINKAAGERRVANRIAAFARSGGKIPVRPT